MNSFQNPTSGTCLTSVRQKEVLVAPFLVLWVKGFVMLVTSHFERFVKVSHILESGKIDTDTHDRQCRCNEHPTKTSTHTHSTLR